MKNNEKKDKDNQSKHSIPAGVIIGDAIKDDYSKIGATQAHGFVAEKAHNLVDKAFLRNVKDVGSNNAKDGADRLVNGTYTQMKYYKTAGGTASSLFNDNTYRYINEDGTPMVIEVPKDQYNEVVEKMKEAISAGKIPGITDPNEASSLIKSGYFSYDSVVKMTESGTIEGLLYDAASGTVTSLFVGGISAGLTLAFNLFKTNDLNESLKIAVRQGQKTFQVSLVSYVVSAQLMRKEIVRNIVNKIGSKVFGSMVSAGVLVGYQAMSDLKKVFKGELDFMEALKNLGKNTITAGAGLVGAAIGSKVGGVFGGIIGGIGGAIIGAIQGEKIFGHKKDNVEEKLNRLARDLQIEIEQYNSIEQSFIEYEKIREIIISEAGLNRLMNDYYSFLEYLKGLIAMQVDKADYKININILNYQESFILAEDKYITEYQEALVEKINLIEERVKKLASLHIAKLNF